MMYNRYQVGDGIIYRHPLTHETGHGYVRSVRTKNYVSTYTVALIAQDGHYSTITDYHGEVQRFAERDLKYIGMV